jgi:hypothetical protein
MRTDHHPPQYVAMTCVYTKVIFQENGTKHGKTRKFGTTSCFSGLSYALHTEIRTKAIGLVDFLPRFALAAGDTG